MNKIVHISGGARPYFGPSTTIAYVDSVTTRTVNSREYKEVINAAGWITKRTDPAGSIVYKYFPNGNLRSTLAPGGILTSMTYDKNGNRLTLSDPSAGTTTQSWYGTGQLKSIQNAIGETTTYTYQADGLLDYYTASPADEGQTNYTYNGKKQLSNITSPGGVSRSYTYGTDGRDSIISESIDGVSNEVRFIYDTKGRLFRKYFNGTDYEQYDYDTNSGYLYRIQFNGTTVWQLTSMDEYLRTRQANIGTTAASWNYDTGSNMLSQVVATGVQCYNYSFDENTGNLQWRTNALKSKTENFDYDGVSLDRLTLVTGPVNMSIGYTPDKNGNIQTKSDAGTYVYDATQPYAVDLVNSGQNISTTQQDITYYSFGKVKKITEGTKTAEFVYNSDNQRIRMILKTSGTATKTRWYFGNSCERELVGGVTTQYIWIGGDAYTAVAVAKKIGTGAWTVYNIFRDHLGTITHLKDAGSGIYSEYSFDAWGRRRDKDDWTMTLTSEPTLFADRGFTAHEYLEDFKLYNMNGRLYDPVVGRFLSPDPQVGFPDFTQSYNRYSYCLNNPLAYTDPDGENPLFFILGFVAGAYLGGTAANDWQWNPGKWDYQDPGTYFGIVGGGLAGGLGLQWTFGPGGILAGGTPLNISLGASIGNMATAFANVSIGGGSGIALQTAGYLTAAGGGVILTGSAIKEFIKNHFLFESEFRIDHGAQFAIEGEAFGAKVGLSGEKESEPLAQLNFGYNENFYGNAYAFDDPSYGYGGVNDAIRTSWSGALILGASQNFNPHRNIFKVGYLESENISWGIVNISKRYGSSGKVLEKQYTFDFGFDLAFYLGISGKFRFGYKH